MCLYVDIGINIQGLVMICSCRSRLRHAQYINFSIKVEHLASLSTCELVIRS